MKEDVASFLNAPHFLRVMVVVRVGLRVKVWVRIRVRVMIMVRVILPDRHATNFLMSRPQSHPGDRDKEIVGNNRQRRNMRKCITYESYRDARPSVENCSEWGPGTDTVLGKT